LIALERRKARAMKVYTHARDRGLVVATPNVTLAEWWRGRSDRRDAVLGGLLVEPVSDEVMKLAGLALGRVRDHPRTCMNASFTASCARDSVQSGCIDRIHAASSRRADQ
jgi:hypothetical protein